MKIHITMETKLLLDTLGRFHTEHRGMVQVKGKGLLYTYWLIGKEGGIAKQDTEEIAFNSEEAPAYMKDIRELAHWVITYCY